MSLAAVLAAVNTAGSGATAQTTRPALHIAVIEGEGAINVVQQRTAVAAVVEVRDRNDQPVAGVTFTVKGGRAAFSSGGSTWRGTESLAATGGIRPRPGCD